MEEHIRTLPNRLADYVPEDLKSRVWFEEMLIQRDYRFKFAEQLYVGQDGLLWFYIDTKPGQRTHADLPIQKAYKKWLDKQVDKVLLE